MLIFLPLPRLQRRWLSSFSNAANQQPCTVCCSQQLLMKVPPTEEDGVQTPGEVRWKCQLEETEREPWGRALIHLEKKSSMISLQGFPGGSDSKESACKAGATGRSPGGVSGGNPMDRGAWQATVLVAKSQTLLSMQTHTHTHTHVITVPTLNSELWEFGQEHFTPPSLRFVICKMGTGVWGLEAEV